MWRCSIFKKRRRTVSNEFSASDLLLRSPEIIAQERYWRKRKEMTKEFAKIIDDDIAENLNKQEHK